MSRAGVLPATLITAVMACVLAGLWFVLPLTRRGDRLAGDGASDHPHAGLRSGRDTEDVQHRRPQRLAQFLVGQVGQLRQEFRDG